MPIDPPLCKICQKREWGHVCSGAGRSHRTKPAVVEQPAKASFRKGATKTKIKAKGSKRK